MATLGVRRMKIAVSLTAAQRHEPVLERTWELGYASTLTGGQHKSHDWSAYLNSMVVAKETHGTDYNEA